MIPQFKNLIQLLQKLLSKYNTRRQPFDDSFGLSSMQTYIRLIQHTVAPNDISHQLERSMPMLGRGIVLIMLLSSILTETGGGDKYPDARAQTTNCQLTPSFLHLSHLRFSGFVFPGKLFTIELEHE
jgi:hypothetical protein